MIEQKNDLDVLIVGAGPVGLFCATELIRHGLTCRIIDKKTQLSEQSKALAIHIRTLDVFKDGGFLDAFLSHGHQIHGGIFKANQQQLANINFDNIDANYRFVLDLPQDQTERLLYQVIQNHGMAVEWQTELVDMNQSDRGVQATVTTQDGQQQQINANWLIACDGAHSTLRHVVGADFLGAAYPEHWWLADVDLAWSMPDDKMVIYLTPQGPLACFPMGAKRYRIVLTAPAGTNPTDSPSLCDVTHAFGERSSDLATLTNPRWLTAFSIHHRQLQQYRYQRLFFAGDAAHIHSPMGGQGMNTGIQDGYNLIWKLALVQRGQAPDDLLNSYHEERYPVGKSVLKKTDVMTKMILIQNRFLKMLRNYLIRGLTSISYFRQKIIRDLAELTISYAHSSIVQESGEKTGLNIGEFVPMIQLTSLQLNQKQTLLDIIQGTKHHVFFLVGQPTSDGSTFNATHLAALTAYQQVLDSHLIITDTFEGSTALPSVWVDTEQVFQQQFGLSNSAIMLVRPDKYIGFLQSPIDMKTFTDYLNRLFTI